MGHAGIAGDRVKPELTDSPYDVSGWPYYSSTGKACQQKVAGIVPNVSGRSPGSAGEQ